MLLAGRANDARLSEIYARLQEIDAESAPARASVILAGLGFSPEMQVSSSTLGGSIISLYMNETSFTVCSFSVRPPKNFPEVGE